MDSINRTTPAAAPLAGPAFTVVNDTASQQVNDTVTISGATANGDTRTYKPNYQFGRAQHSCGAFDGFEVAEVISVADACKLRDQLHITVRGIPSTTPDVYKDVKPFSNPPTYTWGMVDTTASCGAMLTVNWSIPTNEVSTPSEAKAFCKKYHIPYRDR